MKYTEDRSYADPEKAAERILEIANSVRTVASISRRSTARSCLTTKARLRSTAPAWDWQSSAGGSNCMRAARS